MKGHAKTIENSHWQTTGALPFAVDQQRQGFGSISFDFSGSLQKGNKAL
jgi:hypothetical protein